MDIPNLTAKPLPLRGHIPALDAVRGLAIVLVTLYRFRPNGDGILDRLLDKVLNFAQFGVPLFFVLSGFLITGILSDTKQNPDYFRGFYIRRALRIFPLYYAVLIIGLFVLPWIFQGTNSFFTQPQPYQGWLWVHGSNLIMSWENRWLFGGFDHFWSLAVEEHFYLIWPLVIWLTPRRQAMWISGLCVATSVLGRCGLVLAGHFNPAADLFTLCQLDCIAMGSWLALYLRGTYDAAATRKYAVIATWVGLCLAVGVIAFRKFPGATPIVVELVYYTCYFWFGVGFCGLLLAALGSETNSLAGRFWNQPALIAAGKYSYGWYVFQGLLRPDFMAWNLDAQIDAALGFAGLGGIVQMLVGFCLSLLLAILSWRILESPILSLKDVLAPRSFATPQGVTSSNRA